jgi:predicted transcriptional regulator
MPTKVNIVLDDDVKADLDRLVVSGMRSRVVNRALRKEILAIRRQRASARLDDLRRTTRPISTSVVLARIRRDRGR